MGVPVSSDQVLWHEGGIGADVRGVSVIEVFADVSCPFAHVGIRRWFERREASGAHHVRLRVRAWPLEIVNGSGLDGPHVAPKVDALRAQAAPDLFVGFDPSSFPGSTLPALRLTHAAYEIGTEVGEAVARELRDALWEQGMDVGDPSVLAAVADWFGVDGFDAADAADPGDAPEMDPVLADLEDGRRRGVVGSPHFFGPDWSMFCPTLAIAHDENGLRVERALAAFEELATASFGP